MNTLADVVRRGDRPGRRFSLRPPITILRLALVSCVKQKRGKPAAAEDLYTSVLFRGLRAHAERNADRWLILSAEHGVLEPATIVVPYERSLLRMRNRERVEWAERVRVQLTPHLIGVESVLVLAGARYREHLMEFLRLEGRRVEIPLDRKPIGCQLKWLKAQNEG